MRCRFGRIKKLEAGRRRSIQVGASKPDDKFDMEVTRNPRLYLPGESTCSRLFSP